MNYELCICIWRKWRAKCILYQVPGTCTMYWSMIQWCEVWTTSTRVPGNKLAWYQGQVQCTSTRYSEFRERRRPPSPHPSDFTFKSYISYTVSRFSISIRLIDAFDKQRLLWIPPLFQTKFPYWVVLHTFYNIPSRVDRKYLAIRKGNRSFWIRLLDDCICNIKIIEGVTLYHTQRTPDEIQVWSTRRSC